MRFHRIIRNTLFNVPVTACAENNSKQKIAKPSLNYSDQFTTNWCVILPSLLLALLLLFVRVLAGFDGW